MREIYVCSDHHFGHANIIRYANRPMADVIEMNEALIERHNKVVKPSDIVYFLGDVTFNKECLYKVMPRLMGKKRLILGNHDNLNMSDYTKFFEKIMGARNFKFDGIRYELTHYPIIVNDSPPAGFNLVSVHGHIHDQIVPNSRRHINVCVEHTNYTPLHIDEIRNKTKHLR